MTERAVRLGTLCVLAAALCGCSIRQLAVDMIGDALADSGTTFTSDDDVELIGEALPFGLKLQESLLAESPEHRGLLLAAGSGYTQYAHAFVMAEADRLEPTDIKRSRELRARARKLFLRGRDYALRGLELEHPGITEALMDDRREALAATEKDDVPFLYWAGVSWAGALSVAKGDLDLVGQLPMGAALVERSLELDETFGKGAAHEFLISYEGSRSDAMGGSAKRALEHYHRALELSEGKRASVHLALAESVMVKQQNLAEFRRLINAALAVDPDEVVELRLANALARRRAVMLEERIADLFLAATPDDGK